MATALAANRQAVYVGTCEGELLAWSWQGNPQMRLRLAAGPVGNLCVDESGLRAAQSGDTVIYFRERGICGKSGHGDQMPSMAALEEAHRDVHADRGGLRRGGQIRVVSVR